VLCIALKGGGVPKVGVGGDGLAGVQVAYRV
jgi:hypothetical protein